MQILIMVSGLTGIKNVLPHKYHRELNTIVQRKSVESVFLSVYHLMGGGGGGGGAMSSQRVYGKDSSADNAMDRD